MRTRAEAIGTTLTVQRVQPRGTRLELVWPLADGVG